MREALLRLEGEGLVRLYPKKGALVVPLSVDEARDVLEARIVIEEWAARAVWPRRAALLPALEAELERMRATLESGGRRRLVEHDRRFHELVVEAAGNAILTRTYQGLRDRQLTILAAASSARRRPDRAGRRPTTSGWWRSCGPARSNELVAETHTHVRHALAALPVGR